MQRKDNTKPKASKPLDEQLWQKVRAHHHIKNLAEKAERIGRETDKERQELFATTLKTWAKHTPLRQHFPDTKDFCTAEAVFRLCYCNKIIKAGEWQRVDGDYSKINEAAHDGRQYAIFVANKILKNAPIIEIKEAILSLADRCKKAKHNKKTEATPKKQGALSTHLACFNWPYFGVHIGDVLTVEDDGKASIGKLALLCEEGGEPVFARVCSIKGDTVRSAGDGGESEDSPLNLVVGTVVEIDHTNCNQTKADTLRKQILRLQNDDEAWANVTRIAELEAEIFNLEHPPEEEEGEEFEWPEVIGDE